MKKQDTKKEILKALKNNTSMTRQELAKTLGISMPTALQNCNELLEQGILVEIGELESTGGRKAKSLGLNGAYAYGLGIEIGLGYIEVLIEDMSAHVVEKKKLNTVFCDEPAWYMGLLEGIEAFLKESKISKDKIIAAGVSFPGIIDEEMEMIQRSHILNIEHVALDRLKTSIPFPMYIDNDANCAAFSEIDESEDSFFYLSLNDSVGGAMIMNGKIVYGSTMQTGEVGHMILVPGGEQCYCGKKGCVDPYLSPQRFKKDGKTLDAFFKALAGGKKKSTALWEEYLEHLAITVTNLRMVLNTDIVIGGEMANRLEPWMDQLKTKCMSYDLFAREISYLRLGTQREDACAVGAARKAIDRYRASIL